MNNQFNSIGNQISHFEHLGYVGNGSFGVVSKMRSRLNNQIYAVKQIEMPKGNNIKEDLIKLMREATIMGNAYHPNLVRLYTAFQDNKYQYFVSEFIEGQNLENFIYKYKQHGQHLNQSLVINIFKQILNGLIYLHSNGIMHRDIKPDNMLIDAYNNIKIIDFGISAFYIKHYGYLSSRGTQVGRPDYVCPEILLKRPYNLKCDIFSLGYTMYFVMNCDLPSKTDNAGNRIKKNNLNFNNNYDRNLVQLIERMYRDNPEQRPTSTEALNELLVIEKNINNNIINNFNSQLNVQSDNGLISSLNCVLQCLFGLNNIGMVKKIVINNSKNKQINFLFFPLGFFNFFDLIEKKRNNSINSFEYNKSLQILLNHLLQKNPLTNSAKPKDLYCNILLLFQKEFNLLIEWTNKMISFKYKNPEDYPQNRFPKVVNEIDNYKKNYNNPLADMFYFILITSQRCPLCETVYYAYSEAKSFLPLNNQNKGNIMTLIRNYFGQKSSNQFIQCRCGYNKNLVEEIEFYNTPDYLVLDLGENEQIEVDEQIDLSEYIKTNYGLRKFKLYAAINKKVVNNSPVQYVCSIKEKDSYTFCEGDSIEKCGNECLKIGFPSCVIYKKIA